MSLWYDIKNKVYSSGPMDNWYISYLKNVCSTLVNNVTELISSHTEGKSGRHSCEHIDYDDSLTLKGFLDAETSERAEGDRLVKLALQEAINNETSQRRAEDIAISTQMHQLIFAEETARNEGLASEETARKEGLALKVDKVTGKGLSSNDYTDAEKETLEKTAGKKVMGNPLSDISITERGEPALSVTDLTCHEGSEVFNDYSNNQAYGLYSHAEGQYTTAKGNYSHAEGILTKALGNNSHAEGHLTCASGKNQHAQGILNLEDNENKYAHIVGNGHIDYSPEDNTETHIRSNAHTLDWDGNAWYAGDVICGDAETGLQAQITDLYNKRPDVMTETADILSVNKIYDLGMCDSLTLALPDGSVGDWIKVDFISGDTPTELSVITDKISDHSIITDANTAYSLIFDWGRLNAYSYGWRFSYNEYTKAVTE